MNNNINTSKVQKDLIEALSRNEFAVGALYKVYEDKFPEYKDFWSHLVSDEKNHGTWIKTLLSDVNTGKLSIDENRFNAEPIVSFTEYLQELRNEALKGDIKLINALSNAKDIESGLIEREFFKVYETDSPILKHVLNDLEKVTKVHESMVADAWKKESNSS